MSMFPKMKIVLALLLFVLVSSASALIIKPDIDKVQSKEGNLELTQFEDGSGSTCTMFFEEPASIRKDGGPKVLLKTSSGCIGWVEKRYLEYVPLPKYNLAPYEDEFGNLTLLGHMQDEADSIALFYGDSTLQNITSIEQFIHRHNEIRDSLYRHIMNHPEEAIEHWEFLKPRLKRTTKYSYNERANNVFFARMEWDSLTTAFSLESDSIFDSIYTANRSQYPKSLQKIRPNKRRLITIAIIDYENHLRTKNGKPQDDLCYMNLIEMQSLADSIVREEPQYDTIIYKHHYHIGTNAYSTNTLPKRYSRKEAPSYYFAGGFNFSHAIGKHNSVHGDFIGFNLILLGFSTRIGVFALNTSYGFGINSGDEFTDSNKNNPKTFKHNSFMSFVDGSILYRPAICIHDILNKWAVQPEFGLGVHALDDAILYYSVGIRYEKSTARQEWNMRQPYGIIDGWSIGLASKWSGINFKGITLDIRWAIHA